jgi:catechol 2,3-dioxygenase-like lactoylglutathione lyase family enzyme
VGSVHHVVVNVRHLERSVAFYRDLLGLRCDGVVTTSGSALERALRLPPGSHGNVAFLRGSRGPGRIELVEWLGPPGGAERDRTEGTSANGLGLRILSFECGRDELYEVCSRLRAAGHPCWSEPQELQVGPDRILVCAVEDPDGNVMEFFAAD